MVVVCNGTTSKTETTETLFNKNRLFNTFKIKKITLAITFLEKEMRYKRNNGLCAHHCQIVKNSIFSTSWRTYWGALSLPLFVGQLFSLHKRDPGNPPPTPPNPQPRYPTGRPFTPPSEEDPNSHLLYPPIFWLLRMRKHPPHPCQHGSYQPGREGEGVRLPSPSLCTVQLISVLLQ